MYGMLVFVLAFCLGAVIGLAIATYRSIGWSGLEPTTLDRLRAVVKAEK